MRLCIIQVTDIPERHIGPTLEMFKPSFEKVLRPDTEVTMKSARGGLRGDDPLYMDNPYFAFLNKRAVVEAIIEADREGYDAMFVACFGDPGVREARAVVKTPLFGAAESTLLFACQLGRKIAIITANMPGQVAQVEEQVRFHGLEHRLAQRGVRMDRDPFEEAWQRYVKNPDIAAASIGQVARECVDDGADVVIIGCCGFGPLCTAAGLNKVAVDGNTVPVLDPIMIVAKTAEMAADIGKGAGLPIPSRAREQVLPTEEAFTKVRTMFGLS